MAASVLKGSDQLHELREIYQSVRRGAALDYSMLLVLKYALSFSAEEGSNPDCLLLALTTVRLILEKQEHYSGICEQLLDASETLQNTLVSLLDSDDLHVSFASCKTLVQVVKGLKELPESILTQLDSCQKSNGLVHALNLFSTVLSKKSGVCAGVKNQCMQHISEHWVCTVATCLNCPRSDSICYSFLCLWLKMIKHKQQVAVVDLTEPLFIDSSLLIKKILKQSIPASCWCRAVDVLNAMIPYISKYGRISEETSHAMVRYAPLVSSVLGAVANGLLCSLPVVSNASGFGSRAAYHTAKIDSKVADQRAVRRVALLVLKACSLKLGGLTANSLPQESLVGAQDAWQQILHIESMTVSNPESDSVDSHWIINLFEDQDDKMIEAILCALDSYTFYQRIMSGGTGGPRASGCDQRLDPHHVFCALLYSIAWDHSILLDFLTSPETGFLVYLLRYLKYLATDWPSFVQVCEARSGCLQFVEPENNYGLAHSGIKQGKQECSMIQADLSTEASDSTPVKLRDSSSKLQSLVCYSDSSDSNEDEDGELPPVSGLHEANFKPAYTKCDSSLQRPEMVPESGSFKLGSAQGKPASVDVSMCGGQLGVHSEAGHDSLLVNSEDFPPREITGDVGDSTFAEEMPKLCDLELSDTDCTKPNKILDDNMSVLIRLRLAIDRLVGKGLFPYNIEPLIGLLEQCEMLYEDTEVAK